ncbi:hypothetical protein Q1695_011134 [Nippostrongylus brasiliensis]|nr:hypothetical protein Q1695_011134 [Nippostrongylus brasiliensis]
MYLRRDPCIAGLITKAAGMRSKRGANPPSTVIVKQDIITVEAPQPASFPSYNPPVQSQPYNVPPPQPQTYQPPPQQTYQTSQSSYGRPPSSYQPPPQYQGPPPPPPPPPPPCPPPPPPPPFHFPYGYPPPPPHYPFSPYGPPPPPCPPPPPPPPPPPFVWWYSEMYKTNTPYSGTQGYQQPSYQAPQQYSQGPAYPSYPPQQVPPYNPSVPAGNPPYPPGMDQTPQVTPWQPAGPDTSSVAGPPAIQVAAETGGAQNNSGMNSNSPSWTSASDSSTPPSPTNSNELAKRNSGQSFPPTDILTPPPATFNRPRGMPGTQS